MRVGITALVWSALGAILAIPTAAFAQPVVTHTIPGAVAPGKTTDVTVFGQKLDDPLSVWTSFPAKVELVPPAEPTPKPGRTQRVIRVTVDAQVQNAVGGLLVGTAEGVSDAVFLMVDDLPAVADNGQNQSPQQAQELTLPAAVDGVGDGAKYDYYKFAVQSGQRLTVDVLAARLGHEFDPVVRLLDPSGKELVMADDDADVGPDCRFAHTFPVSGQFLLEVRDNQYRAGGRYRLRIGDFPLATSAYPAVVQAGVATKIGIAGADANGVAPIDVTAPADMVGRRMSLGFKLPNAASSTGVSVAVSGLPQAVEAEPNNEPAQATAVSTPGGVSGRFDAPSDRDTYQLMAKAGQKFVIKCTSRSFGSPAVVKLFVQKPDGAALAETAVSEADEESLAVTFPADGAYRLIAEDLLKRGGPGFAYHLAIEPIAPFSLALKADKATRSKFSLAKNGALAIDVPVARTGYDGPITLSVDGPGGPYTLFNAVIGEKQATTKLIVFSPTGFQPGQIAGLQIKAQATIDGQPYATSLSTTDLIRLQRPRLSYPPAWMDGLIPTSIAPDLTPFYIATIDRPAVVLARQTLAGEFNVKLERKSDQFKDPLLVMIPNGPPGFAFEVKRNGNGPMETYQVLVKAPANAGDGPFPIKVLTYAELAGKGLPVLSADLPIQIVSPLTVTVAPAEGLVFGNKQKVKLSVTRLTGPVMDRQPVVVKWKKLPPGITGPAEVAIPADQDSAIVELTAAPDAAAAAFTDLTATATTKFQGQDISVDSTPLGGQIVR